MEEGYKFDSNTKILYVSIKPNDKRIIISGNISLGNQDSNIFIGFSRWWNGLDWAVTIHVDDVKDVSRVLANYKDHEQPLTLMIMGNDVSMSVLYSIMIISVLILTPVIVVIIYKYRIIND